MSDADSCVTIHMAASLDGFIARKDGSVDWLETSDVFEGGGTPDPEYVEEFLAGIDCYVMGSRTYETALGFESKGLGWAYGDKPTFVLTSRRLRKIRDTVEFYAGDLAELVNGRLKYPVSEAYGSWEVVRCRVSAFGSVWRMRSATRSCPSSLVTAFPSSKGSTGTCRYT
jgi:hypothetical protein